MKFHNFFLVTFAILVRHTLCKAYLTMYVYRRYVRGGFGLFCFCLSAQSRTVMMIIPLPHYGNNFATQFFGRKVKMCRSLVPPPPKQTPWLRPFVILPHLIGYILKMSNALNMMLQLNSFFLGDKVLSDEIKICYILEYQSNENWAFRFFFLGGGGDTRYNISISIYQSIIIYIYRERLHNT